MHNVLDIIVKENTMGQGCTIAGTRLVYVCQKHCVTFRKVVTFTVAAVTTSNPT